MGQQNISPEKTHNVIFADALAALNNGKMVTRESWEQGSFVFKQIPATITADVIPKMQSLPQSVKDEFAKRGTLSIAYDNQLALVNIKNEISGWSPSSTETLARDWIILE